MQNMFLKIGNSENTIEGESADMTGDEGHVGWVEILSYSHGVIQPASPVVSSAGGRTVERCQHQDFTITKYLDKATPPINQFCCQGNHIDEVTLELYRADATDSATNSPVLYMKYVLEDSIISSASVGGGGGDIPIETVTFNYGAIRWTYKPQEKETGDAGGDIPASWDLLRNKPAA